jgi:hypothetical protein
MKAIICILIICPWIFWGSAAAVVVVDLTGETGHLEYDAQPFAHFFIDKLKNGHMGPSGILFDIDRDGYKDWIRSNYSYISAVGYTHGSTVTYFQANMPPEFCREGKPAFSLVGDLDLDGDGRTEVVVTGHTEDQTLWRFWIMDPHTGDIQGSFDLQGGQDTRPDGFWDGSYRVIDTLECSVDGKDRTALIISVDVGFDLEGRGVLAVDPWTGEILWRYVTGPNPLNFACKVVDLDRDGDREVVFFGRAPDNLDGMKINGYSDNESRLFVLDHQGELLWTHRLGGWFGGGFMVIADLDDDGFEEIVTSTHTTPEVWGEVVVWSHDGSALARRTSSDSESRNVVLIPDTAGGSPRLAVASKIGAVQVFEFAPPDLKLVAEVKTGGLPFINCVEDILPPEGPELVFSTQDGTTWILDRNFQPLARSQGKRTAYHSNMVLWRAAPDIDLLMNKMGPGYPLVFAKAPPPPLNKNLIAAMMAVALFIPGAFLYWKKGRSTRLADPVVMREVRLNLLEDLELSGHGAIAPLKCMRRLSWHLNAMTSGLGDNPSIEVRLRETWTECRDNALPHLAGILDRARLAGLAGANVDYAARALTKVGFQLDELEGEDFQVSCFEAVAAELDAETAKADDALKDLRREVAAFFHTDLAGTVTRILRANSQALEEYGVSVQTGYLAQMAAGGEEDSTRNTKSPVTCLIDPKEMDFVLDNLVGNAARAMKDASSPNLAVTWIVADGMVMVDVRDTGCGIPDENRDRIMDTHFSTREGGGEGLPRSRKTLRKYGGGLMILETTPGRGSTFRVTLPVA